MKIANITCERVHTPLAVTNRHPRFSWEITSDEKDVLQSAYHIIVKDHTGALVWDSGKAQSRETVDIMYAGAPLVSSGRYVYQITVWDNHGNEAVSEEERFETALLDSADWKAQWIEPLDPLPQLAENPLPKAQAIWGECMAAMMRGEQPKYYLDSDIWALFEAEPYDPPVRFRRTFTLGEKPEYAKIYMTAHGIYSLSVNGRKVPGTLLAPGFTAYEKRLKYQAYDVTEFLQAGENALCVTVADGWYKGKIALGKGCEYGEVPGLLMQMELWESDGTKSEVCSDGNFTCSYEGPVRYADLFRGECVDARRDDGDPSEAAYVADNWKPVNVLERKEEDYGILTAQTAPAIEVYEEVPAREILTTPNGETVVDFGQNMAGTIRVEIRAEAGEEISFEHGEVLDSDGNFTYAFSDTAHEQKDVYISAGESGRVTGGKDWRPEQFTAKAISSANPVTGSFRCSDEKLNQLQDNIYWSQRSNTVGIPTDCPTREKAGWTGDVVTYGETALYNQEMTAFFEDWLESIRREQKENGHVMNTVPLIKNYIQQTYAGSLGWGDVILTLPMQLYRLSGDKSVLAACRDAMEKWVNAMHIAADELPQGMEESPENENQHYLINTGFHFGDWLVPSVKNEAGFSDGPASSFLTMNVVDTALLAADADLFAETLEILGETEKAEDYKAYAQRVRKAFCEELCTEDGKLKQEMQGSYILALKYHMVPEEMEKGFAARLAEMIVENDYKPDAGFMSVPFILDVLCNYGYRDLAWKVLNQKNCPGWIYEVEHGATTMWENWDAVRPDGAVDKCSFNHYAFGCVGNFLYRRVLGIQNAGIGYDHICLEPGYDFDLDWAEGSYHSVHGEISLRWEKMKNADGSDGAGIKVSGWIPANTEGELVLPDGSRQKLGSGGFEFSMENFREI